MPAVLRKLTSLPLRHLPAPKMQLDEMQLRLQSSEQDAATESLLNVDTVKQSEVLKNLETTVSNLEKQAVASSKSEAALQQELATQKALQIVRSEASKGITVGVAQIERLVTKQQELTQKLRDQKTARTELTRAQAQAEKQVETFEKKLNGLAATEAQVGKSQVEIINLRKQALLDEVAALKLNFNERERLNAKIENLTDKRIKNTEEATKKEKLAFSSTNAAIEDELVSLVRNGELNFKSLVDTAINEFLRLAIIKPLISGISSSFGGTFSSILSSVLSSASGGPVQSRASGGLIQHMQSGGQVRDRVPAMLEPGEFVVRKNAAKSIGLPALQNINRGGGTNQAPEITIINQGTPQEAAEQPDIKFNGENLVIEIITKDLRNNGPIRRGIRGLSKG